MIHRFRWYLIAFSVGFYCFMTADFNNYTVPHRELLAHKPVLPAVANTKMPLFEQEKEPILYNRKDIKCLANNIFFEAGTDSMMSKMAVAQVTINRVKVGYWGDNICDVVHAKDQFSWTKKRNLILDTDSKNYKDSMQAAKSLLNSKLKVRALKHALFYHADYVNPEWVDRNEKVGQFGKHIYYNGAKGSWLSL